MPASNKDEVIKIGFTLLLEITTIKQDKTYKTQFSGHWISNNEWQLFLRDKK